jgi:hypothetical protein
VDIYQELTTNFDQDAGTLDIKAVLAPNLLAYHRRFLTDMKALDSKHALVQIEIEAAKATVTITVHIPKFPPPIPINAKE